ncbi:reverse transcriptase domain-containing protein, partial [Streptomyces hilarionis]
MGNEFLKLVDLTGQIKSSCLVRFMDDFTLFHDNPEVLWQDFTRIQQLLGQYGLNINPSKTYFEKNLSGVEETLTKLRESL